MQVTEILLSNSPISVYSTNTNFKAMDKVVVSSNSGLDLGVVKGVVDSIDATEFVDIIRLATEEDNKKHCENCKYARTLLADIKKEAENHKLDMKVGFISTNLDRTKIIVNYTADGRVDFRDLIKALGAKYKCKIEMRQIGNRDEAKQVGALGVCGRVTCCKAYLSEFDKVSIKMAKNQNISLNPTRINGMCERLLCCLKYEDEYYEEMQKKMPKENSVVVTPDGKGVVTATNFLRETVTVTFTKDETTEVKTYDLKDIQKDKK